MKRLANRMKLFSTSCLVFLSLLNATSKEVALNFEILPNSGTATVAFSTGGQASTTVSYSGNIEATVQFDEKSLRASHIEFTGGSIQIPDTDLLVSGNINYTGLGVFPTSFRIQSAGLEGRFSSPSGPGPISDLNGEILPHDHVSTIFTGLAIATVSVNGVSETQTVNYSQAPQVDLFDDFARLSISEFERLLDKRTLKFVFDVSISESDSSPIEGSTTSIISTEAGFYEAVAFVEIPTVLGYWLDQNGLTLSDFQSKNKFGIPVSLIYALDLPIDAKRLPVEFQASSQNILPVLAIELPVSGLKRRIVPHFSYDLAPGSWSPLSSNNYLDGVSSLGVGETGTVRIAFDDWHRGFIRFSVAPDL